MVSVVKQKVTNSMKKKCQICRKKPTGIRFVIEYQEPAFGTIWHKSEVFCSKKCLLKDRDMRIAELKEEYKC